MLVYNGNNKEMNPKVDLKKKGMGRNDMEIVSYLTTYIMVLSVIIWMINITMNQFKK